jgi:glutathione S-transferase
MTGSKRTDRAQHHTSAAAQDVYMALIDRDAVARWMPPDGATSQIHAFEPRVGGDFKMTLRFGGSTGSAGQGKSSTDSDDIDARFVALEPGKLVKHEIQFVSDKARFAGTMTMTWELTPRDGGTDITVVAENVPLGIDADDHQKGLHSSLKQLAEFVERRHGDPSTPTITAFEDSPDRGKGLARDMRVRWALEEVRQRYAVRLLSMPALKEPAHLSLNPFGSIPTYQEGDLVLFESGAIVLHLANRHPALLPAENNARERAIAWMFAALNTVEPPIVEREMATELERDEPWFETRLRSIDERVRDRLRRLSAHLGDAEWLDGSFSAGDLLMIEVLLRLEGALLDEFPNVCAYVARGQSRPAFKRAFAAQREVFEAGVLGRRHDESRTPRDP